MKRWRGRVTMALVAAAVLGAIIWALRPRSVEVDLAPVVRGPLRVTIDHEGQTRVRERYVLSAPLAGYLRRIPWEAGDAIEAGVTVLAVIEPTAPALLDVRAQAQAQARAAAAEAGLSQAQANVARSQAELELAESDAGDLQRLVARGAAAEREARNAELLVQVRRRAVEVAERAVEIARFELELARAALLRAGQEAPQPLVIHAPCDGRILRVLQESAAVVAPGQPLLEVADPADLEVVVDVLSADAVRIRRGDVAWLEAWGGGEPLRGRVRVVEPSGFTKVSALGVEEQRVNVIIDLLDPPRRWASLGDGYRVEARVVVWEAEDVLKVPTSALFRATLADPEASGGQAGRADREAYASQGGQAGQQERDDRGGRMGEAGGAWAVFVAVDGRAELRPVEIGQQTPQEAQVLAGLRAGEWVVAYPGDRVAPEVAIEPR